MSNTKQRRIRQYSLCMMWLIPAIAFLSVLAPTLYWLGDVNVIWFGDSNLVLAENPPLKDRRFVGVIAVAPALTVWLIALYQLFAMFRNFHAGSVFALSTIRRIRAYALFAGLTALLTIAGSGARRWAQGEFSDQPLWTHIQISLEHWLLIFTAAIFYFVSFALEWAKDYKDEAESYI